MAERAAFCVVCGKETEEPLRSGECATCYLEKNTLVEVAPTFDVDICAHCHARKRGEVWVAGHGRIEPVVEEAAREVVAWSKVVDRPRLESEVVPEDERNFTVHFIARGVADGVPFETPLTTRGRVKGATCLRCSRYQGGYFESIVQVRASGRDLDTEELRGMRAHASRFIERLVAEGDPNAFVLKDAATDGGLDIYMGTINSGRMLAKTFANDHGGRVTESHKLAGKKDGNDIVRMTFAVRLPGYRVGDVLVHDDAPHRVTALTPKRAQLVELVSGRHVHAEHTRLEKADVVRADDTREAVVVTGDEKELQLLDPWTYQTVTVLRPAGLDRVDETVRVARHGDELFVLA